MGTMARRRRRAVVVMVRVMAVPVLVPVMLYRGADGGSCGQRAHSYGGSASGRHGAVPVTVRRAGRQEGKSEPREGKKPEGFDRSVHGLKKCGWYRRPGLHPVSAHVPHFLFKHVTTPQEIPASPIPMRVNAPEQPFQAGTPCPTGLNTNIRMPQRAGMRMWKAFIFRCPGKARTDYFFSVTGSMRTGL